MGLLRWIGNQRRWRQEHITAFEAVSQIQPDGLTTFQHQALNTIAKFVSVEQFKRIAMGQESGVYSLAPLGASGAVGSFSWRLLALLSIAGAGVAKAGHMVKRDEITFDPSSRLSHFKHQ